MNWKLLEERPVDSIGRNKMILSSPGRRVWHSTTRVGEYLVVFGGLRTRYFKYIYFVIQYIFYYLIYIYFFFF